MNVQRRTGRDLELASRSSSGVAVTRREGMFRSVRVMWDVTLVSGSSPVLLIWVEAPTEAINWIPIATTYDIIGVSKGSFIVHVLPDIWRIGYNLSGDTPKFTFTVFTYLLN